MIARFICRRRGHLLHTDPGDCVLYCTRCHAMVDLWEVLT